MRTRVISGPNCPIIPTAEYSWLPNTYPRTDAKRQSSAYAATNPGGVVNWTIPNGYHSYYESMTDEVGSDGRFRPCLHYIETNAFSADLVQVNGNYGSLGNAYCRPCSVSWITNAHRAVPIPALDWTAASQQAMSYMLPSITGDTSVVNFLVELKDLKHNNPIPSIKRILNRHLALSELKDSYKRRKFLKELTHRLTGAHLNASFGIVPFVRDIEQMYDSMTNLSMKLEQLKQHANKRLVRHYRRVLPSAPGVWPIANLKQVITLAEIPGMKTSWPSAFSLDNTGGGSRPLIPVGMGYNWTLRPTYYATMRYSYSLPDMGPVQEWIATRLDALGARLDPGIVWDGIGFSFLVDWLVDVSSYLHQFGRNNYNIETKVTDFCHSMAYRYELDIRMDPFFQFTSNPALYPIATHFEAPVVYSSTRSNFDRRVTSPDLRSIVGKIPNLRQAALAGSLILQRTNSLIDRSYHYDPSTRKPLINRKK